MTDQAQNDVQPESPFNIHKIYVKDVSFEIPDGVAVFTNDWKPELNVEVTSASKALSEADTHEVTLTVKCTVQSAGKKAFEAEVQQAGIFTVVGLDEAQLKHTLGAFCPSLLYPYLREVISDMVLKGGFPQLNLAPINFDMLYEQNENPDASTDNVTELHPEKTTDGE